MAAAKQLLRPSPPCASSAHPCLQIQSPHLPRLASPAAAKLALPGNNARPCGLSAGRRRRLPPALPRASASSGSAASASGDGEDGVSLGTMKLPPDTDLARFELLLFQVDRVKGGARLGFVKMGDAGAVEVPVYIDCLVFPADVGAAAGSDRPLFRAIRNGSLKDQVAPGEQRIMRSLLQALQTSVEIARV